MIMIRIKFNDNVFIISIIFKKYVKLYRGHLINSQRGGDNNQGLRKAIIFRTQSQCFKIKMQTTKYVCELNLIVKNKFALM